MAHVLREASTPPSTLTRARTARAASPGTGPTAKPAAVRLRRAWTNFLPPGYDTEIRRLI